MGRRVPVDRSKCPDGLTSESVTGATGEVGGLPTNHADEWLEALGWSVNGVATMQRGLLVVDCATMRILGANLRARGLLCGDAVSFDELVADGTLSSPDAGLIAGHATDGFDAPSWSASVRAHRESGSEEVVVVGATVIHPGWAARALVLMVCRPGEEDAVADYDVEFGAPGVLQFVYDSALRVVLADPRLRLYGIDASSMVGMITWVTVHPEDIPIAQPRVVEVLGGLAEMATYTVRVASPSVGLWTPVRVELRLLVGNGDTADQRLLATVEPVGTFRRTIGPGVLSDRELAIVVELFSGRRVQQIAVRAGVSTKTIRNQLSGVYRKLDVASQTELLDGFHAPARSEAEAR